MKDLEARKTENEEFKRAMPPLVYTIEGIFSQLDIDGNKIDTSEYQENNDLKSLIDTLIAYNIEFSRNYKKIHSGKICLSFMKYFSANTNFERHHTELFFVYVTRRGVAFVQVWGGLAEHLMLIIEHCRKRLCDGWTIQFLT